MVDALNLLMPNGVACVGNHDADAGLVLMAARFGECTFPWVLSNVRDGETHTAWEGVKPFLVVDVPAAAKGSVELPKPVVMSDVQIEQHLQAANEDGLRLLSPVSDGGAAQAGSSDPSPTIVARFGPGPPVSGFPGDAAGSTSEQANGAATGDSHTPPRGTGSGGPSMATSSRPRPPAGSVRVGFLGLAEYAWLETLTTVSLDELEFEPPVDCARRLCPVLRQQLGCDVIVALGHMRLPNDRAFAFEAQALVDIVLSGHDHDVGFELCGGVPVVKSGTEFWWLTQVDMDLTRKISAAEAQARALAGGAGSRALGDPRGPTLTEDGMLGAWTWGDGDVADPERGLTVVPGVPVPSLQTSGRLPHGRVEPVPRHPCDILLFETRAVPTLPPSPEGIALVERWEASVSERMAKVIGETGVGLDARFSEIRTRETNLGSRLCELMRDAVHSDCALLNGGTIRANSIIGPGKITMRDLVAILPMQDPIVKLKLTGKQLVEALENGVSKWPQFEGRFPQVAGIKFAFDGSKPPGERVVLSSVRVRGKPLVTARDAALLGDAETDFGADASVSESSMSTSDASDGPRVTPPAAVTLRRQGQWLPCMSDEGRLPGAEAAAVEAAAKCEGGVAQLTSAASFYMQHAAAVGGAGDAPGTPSVSTGRTLARMGQAGVLAALAPPLAPPAAVATTRHGSVGDVGVAEGNGEAKSGAGTDAECVEPEWWSKEFTLATKAYLARGRDGYSSLAEGEVLIDDENGPLLPNVLRTHLTALQALNGLKLAQHHTDRRRALTAMRRYARRFRSKRKASIVGSLVGAARIASSTPERRSGQPEEPGEEQAVDDEGEAADIRSKSSSSGSIIVSADTLREISVPKHAVPEGQRAQPAGCQGGAAAKEAASSAPGAVSASIAALPASMPGTAARAQHDGPSSGSKASLRIHARRRSIAMETSREDGQLPTLERTEVPDGCTVPFVFMAKTHNRISQVGPPPTG